MTAASYRAAIVLRSGAPAVVSFDYDEPERGHRDDPDSFRPGRYLLRRIFTDHAALEVGSTAWMAAAVEIQKHHKPAMLAALCEARGVSGPLPGYFE